MSNTKRRFFFEELTVNVTAFPEQPQMKFGFQATHVIVTNDSKHSLDFSFLKPNLDGRLYEKDGPLALDGLSEGRMWFKVEDATKPVKFRVWAWVR